MYHRVVDLDLDPYSLAVSPKNFDKQIRFLKKYFNIIGMEQLRESLTKGTLPGRSVVITFDDGYYDNLLKAKPILEKYQAPAIFFVTTGMIDKNEEFWWDQLEKIFLSKKVRPKNLELNIGKRYYSWELKTKEHVKTAFKNIYSLFRYMPSSIRDDALKYLLDWAEVGVEQRDTHRTMNYDEIKELITGGLCSIGAHTMTHCSLAFESLDKQEWEIKESKRRLTEINGEEIYDFAYPFGQKEDFSSETIKIIKKVGFKSVMTTLSGNVYSSTDLYNMPRRFIVNSTPLRSFFLMR